MNTTLNDWIEKDPERARLFAQEQLIVGVAEHIWEEMERRQISKSEIAETLGKSKALVTQLLNGTRNMTLRTLSDIAFALDARVHIEIQANAPPKDWSVGKTAQIFTNVISALPVPHKAAQAYGPTPEELVQQTVRAAA